MICKMMPCLPFITFYSVGTCYIVEPKATQKSVGRYHSIKITLRTIWTIQNSLVSYINIMLTTNYKDNPIFTTFCCPARNNYKHSAYYKNRLILLPTGKTSTFRSQPMLVWLKTPGSVRLSWFTMNDFCFQVDHNQKIWFEWSFVKLGYDQHSRNVFKALHPASNFLLFNFNLFCQ